MSEQRYRTKENSIRDALDKKERTISWLARKCKSSQAMMSYVVSGHRSAGESLATAISDALDVPLFLIFEFADVSDMATKAESAA